MIQSFRLRLALLSALLCGLALVAFGLGSWWLIRGIKLDRMDSELRFHAEREVSRERNVEDWQRLEMMVAASLGVRDRSNLAILVQDGSGAEVFRSPHWPAALDAAQFAWPSIQPLPQPSMGFGFWMSEAYAQDAGPGPRPRPFGGPRPEYSANDFLAPERLPPPRDIHKPLPVLRPDGEPRDTPLPMVEPATRTATDAPTRVREEEFAPSFGRDRPDPMQTAAPPSLPTPATVLEAPAIPNLPLHPPQAPPRPRPHSVTVSQLASGHLWRIGLASVPHARLAVVLDAQVIDAEMASIRNAFLIALPFALALIGLGSWLFSARALRPLRRLTDTTRRVTAEGLSQRISSQGEDREFVELIEMFNRMLARLERSFKQATRFSADAAHELKTPLAIVQGQLERVIQSAEDGSPMQEALSSILDETRRLSTISRKLLLLSQADAGRLSVLVQVFDVSKALEDLLEDTRMLAPHLKVTGEIQPGLRLQADGSLLRQVLHNLISNAIKYNVEQGWIHIATARWTQHVEVRVSNASHGIAKADQDKVFERFYRADAAHGRQVEGVGLGLSVSREIARAHGGDLTLRTSTDDAVHFSLLLPMARADGGATQGG